MPLHQKKSLAIACASGSFKGAFAHGVLSALETAGIVADVYAAASSSVLPTAWATIGKANQLGVDYWLSGVKYLQQPDMGMSQIVLGGIANFSPPQTELFAANTPEFIIATSAVITEEAASETQGDKARRLGRKLLVSAAKKQRGWVDEHLQVELFSSKSDKLQLNSNNFDEVAYASSRMLHAWDVSAWVNDKPYIDASYTCMCPAIEMVEAGYQQVIAISNEPGVLYRDMFQLEEIPASYNGADIYIIKPDMDVKELGVDFTSATKEGLIAAYQHGLDQGILVLN